MLCINIDKIKVNVYNAISLLYHYFSNYKVYKLNLRINKTDIQINKYLNQKINSHLQKVDDSELIQEWYKQTITSSEEE